MTVEFAEIRARLNNYKRQGKKIFTSSSFQTHSIPLLHIISRIDREIPVVFLNTGFHFPETLLFRDQIIDRFGLNLVDLKPETPKVMQMGSDGKLLFTSDPDRCCHLNKTLPMEQILIHHDVWISGIRADQNANRMKIQVEESAPHDVIRFHPLLDWSAREIYAYRKEYDLPGHPLEDRGYLSIGCEPCTRRFDPESMEREARWFGLNKSECGLHTDLLNRSL